MAVIAALSTAPAQAAEQGEGLLAFSGVGGQALTLTVSGRPLKLAVPFAHPRLAGQDGTVGGLLIQTGPEVVARLVLVNAPGFSRALSLGTGGFDLVLTPGRYRVTLLGTTRQTVEMPILSGQRSRTLVATGPARPVTRTFAGSTDRIQQWSHRLGTVRAGDTLIVGTGGSGALGAHASQTCLRDRPPAIGEPCLELDDADVHVLGGASFTSSTISMQGADKAFFYTGQIQAVGAATTAGYVAIVVAPRR